MEKKTLEAGKFYWFRQKYERIRRIGYVSQDCDENLFLEVLGFKTAMEVSKMNLDYLEFVKINKPSVV